MGWTQIGRIDCRLGDVAVAAIAVAAAVAEDGKSSGVAPLDTYVTASEADAVSGPS
jgi:hypothetical protein